MPRIRLFVPIFLFFLALRIYPESFRTLVAGDLEVSFDRAGGSSVSLGINGAAAISLGADRRFLRGIELELSAPQAWLSYQGSLVIVIYNDLNRQVAAGVADLEGTQVLFEPLPGKLQNVYQIPIRPAHGLRTTPYVTVPAGIVRPASFPILFRFIPVVKGLTAELENMVFQLTARPILSDEGAVRLVPRYPPQLRSRPFTLLIDDVLIENINDELILREGEHHLVVLSEDYRNESRRFVIERAKTLELIIELQDPTPLIIFEGPENASIFLNNAPVSRARGPIQVEPGTHEAKFQIGDYTVIKTLNIQRGKTYRVALDIDLTVHEVD
ncbi:MAG: hypothetical protein FWG99_11615 [Treponema sp.]|nr:hypothetical protein [Treponema sp.]